MENVGAGGIRQKVRGPGKLGQLLGLPRVRRHVYIGAFRLVGATASVTAQIVVGQWPTASDAQTCACFACQTWE